jgi:hypothetical protein
MPSTQYEIRVSGRLNLERASWFGDLILTVEHKAGGTAITVLSGPVADRAALFGILSRIRDLGLTLISVNPVGKDTHEIPNAQECKGEP